ncbi:MAG: bestrophin-like domain [Planctomycetaceae bacterium]
MYFGPLDVVPLWAFFLAAVAASIAGLECGYRVGRWRRARAAQEKEAPVGAMVGSILGLLAIMLAFTFNLAASRFEARRQGVLDESNAVGTTFLRARLLPEPQRSEIADLLREYVDVRLQTVREGTASEGIARSEQLHAELWSRAVAAAENSKGSMTTALFLQSLNEVIDLHAKRVQVGLRSRLPVTIWIALFGLALLGMAAMGYQTGLSGTQRTPAELLLALAFAGVLFLIVDLDRAHEGLLRVGQQPLIDLQRTMTMQSTQ